jgi:hypothetical protein
MQMSPQRLWVVAAFVLAAAACSEDEETLDAGVGAGGQAAGGQAAGGSPTGGTPTGGTPTGGTPTGGTPTGGAAVGPDAAVLPDAAPVPDAHVDTCPADLAAEVVDVNAHPDGEGFRYDGDTTAAMNRTTSPCGGDDAPEVIHRFVAPRTGGWRVDTESTSPKWDTVLSSRATCLDSASVSCNDDGAYPPMSQITFDLDAGEEVYLVVDGHTGGPSPDRGPYTLSITPR